MARVECAKKRKKGGGERRHPCYYGPWPVKGKKKKRKGRGGEESEEHVSGRPSRPFSTWTAVHERRVLGEKKKKKKKKKGGEPYVLCSLPNLIPLSER